MTADALASHILAALPANPANDTPLDAHRRRLVDAALDADPSAVAQAQPAYLDP